MSGGAFFDDLAINLPGQILGLTGAPIMVFYSLVRVAVGLGKAPRLAIVDTLGNDAANYRNGSKIHLEFEQ